MIDKPKRKNDEPNLRRCRWFFGMLAIVLLIPLRTPENIAITLSGYVFVFFLSIAMTLVFVLSYGIRQRVILLMLVCLVMPIVQSVFMVQHEIVFPRDCESEQRGVLLIKTCTEHCSTGRADESVSYSTQYLTLMELPVAILIEPIWDEHFMSDCYGSD